MRLNQHHSEKAKKKMSLTHKGKHYSPKTEFKKGIIPWNTGKTLPQDIKRKMAEAHRGKSSGNLGNRWVMSNEIKEKIRESNSGYKHYNWKGGITPINQRIRGSLEYKLWSDSVWNRDNNNCQKCGESRLRNLVAHHIQNFAQYPELRFAIDNGITFCRNCHKKFHKKYGKNNNTKKQLDKFLK